MNHKSCRGRFAPSPSGRMHLGNIFTALISWLSVRKTGGEWILRIEDLDPQRSRLDYVRLIEDDLDWLGLDFDEGGSAGKGDSGPYTQSERGRFYRDALAGLRRQGLTYPCYCTRNEILSTVAPHESDGRIVYQGTCRPVRLGARFIGPPEGAKERSERIIVPDREIRFTDLIFGRQSVNLSAHCGDFVLRRSDGAWAYQLAVVVDDALMGITEVVRGCDLLLSSAQQIYLYELLGYAPPQFIHLPLICNEKGVRLSKRDGALSMENLRKRYASEELTGYLAWIAGVLPNPEPATPHDLISVFDFAKLHLDKPKIILNSFGGFHKPQR